MKNYKRALRREAKKNKLIKRAKNFIRPDHNLFYDKVYDASYIEIRESILKGECYTFLRTTGNPCNCYMCSGYNKYKRDQKQNRINPK